MTNPLPNLSAAEYRALREDIEANGLIYPIVVDQTGVVIDGHHRRRICKELGIDEKRIVVRVRDKEHRASLALTLNLLRRQMDRRRRDDIIRRLRAEGMTQREVADLTGVSQNRVSELTRGVDVIDPDNMPPDKKGRTTAATRGGRPPKPTPAPDPEPIPEEEPEPDIVNHTHVWVCADCGVFRDSASRATGEEHNG